MTERQKQALRLRSEDKTLDEIAEEMNCTKQNVQQLLETAVSQSFHIRAWYRHEIIYPNIDKWAKDHNMSLTSFSKACGFATSVPLRNCIIYGRDVKKNVIDAILKTTGMSYEVAFMKGEGH